MNYTHYYGYLSTTSDGPANAIQLLATYDKGLADDWFTPYNDRTWDPGLFTVKPHALTAGEQATARLAGYEPDRIRALEISHTTMESENIVAIAPDPKLPPEMPLWWLPYSEETVTEVMARFEASNSNFGQLVRAIRSLESRERFAGVLDAMQNARATAMLRTAAIFKDRNPANQYEEHLLALADSALPPHVPSHNRDWPNALPTFASVRQGWQFKLLFGLIDLFHRP